MNANGSNPKQLTETTPRPIDAGPAWSPDSTKIAYSQGESPGAADNGIHVMSADGTEQHRLLPEGTPILTRNLSWSPDGTKIAYEGASGISTMNSDGTDSSPLVANSGASYPSWVPAPASTTGGGSTPPPATGGGGAPLRPRCRGCCQGRRQNR